MLNLQCINIRSKFSQVVRVELQGRSQNFGLDAVQKTKKTSAIGFAKQNFLVGGSTTRIVLYYPKIEIREVLEGGGGTAYNAKVLKQKYTHNILGRIFWLKWGPINFPLTGYPVGKITT